MITVKQIEWRIAPKSTTTIHGYVGTRRIAFVSEIGMVNSLEPHYQARCMDHFQVFLTRQEGQAFCQSQLNEFVQSIVEA